METKPADVVFLFPPAYGNLGAFRSHLGVAYLRAALAHDDIATVQYLNRRPGTVDQVADDVLGHRPRVVGFTVYDTNFALSLAIARRIKRKQPAVRVVFGGPTPTFCAPQILTHQPDVDACVVGESEESGPRIVTALLGPADLEDPPPGLVVRRGDQIVGGMLPPLAGADSALPGHATLDEVPSPYLTGVLEDGRAGVLTGRGCTHHCQYCSFAALGRKKLRLHSTGRVLDELAFIADLQKRRGESYVVPIHDDAFTLVPARAKSLCQAIIDRHLGLLLSCITRADAVDEELLRLMRDAGFVSLAFGLESAVPSVLRAIGKVRPPASPDSDLEPERVFVERVRKSVTTAKAYGFNVGVSVILGLPTETLEDAEATLGFVKALPIDFYMHNFLWVYPGTPLWDTHDRYAIRCATDSMGLAVTTEYAYDPERLRPLPCCSLEQDARVITALATDALRGCGASSKPEGGISVAVVHAAELNQETAEWLSRVLDVGSMLAHVYPALKRANQARQLSADRRAFSDNLVPARHYVQAVPRAPSNGNRRWSLACSGVDVYATHKPQLVSVVIADDAAPFLDWLAGARVTCSLCDVSDTLLRPAALARFLDDAAEDGIGGRLRRMPVPPALQYPARWLEGEAPCLSLTRIEIDSAGEVRPCRHAESIGRIGDQRQVLQSRLAELAAEVEQRRGCDGCAQPDCPRCPFPGVDDRTYCAIMRQERRALGLLKWIHAYSRVPRLISVERDLVAAD